MITDNPKQICHTKLKWTFLTLYWSCNLSDCSVFAELSDDANVSVPGKHNYLGLLLSKYSCSFASDFGKIYSFLPKSLAKLQLYLLSI